MNSLPRYVFDTNVIISAILFNGSVPGRAFSPVGTAIRLLQPVLGSNQENFGMGSRSPPFMADWCATMPETLMAMA